MLDRLSIPARDSGPLPSSRTIARYVARRARSPFYRDGPYARNGLIMCSRVSLQGVLDRLSIETSNGSVRRFSCVARREASRCKACSIASLSRPEVRRVGVCQEQGCKACSIAFLSRRESKCEGALLCALVARRARSPVYRDAWTTTPTGFHPEVTRRARSPLYRDLALPLGYL